MARLEELTDITLRLSMVPGSRSAAACLPDLTERLQSLDPAPTADTTTIVDQLFRASLTVQPAQISLAVRGAVDLISRRVRRLDGEVGEWVRRETRIMQWELVQSG